MAVPASSPLLQEQRRASMPLLSAASRLPDQAPHQAWPQAAPALAQPLSNGSAAVGSASAARRYSQQTVIGQAPMPWPMPPQQVPNEAAAPAAQLQPSAPAAASEPTQPVPLLTEEAAGAMQLQAAATAQESLQQLSAEPSLAAGFAEQQTWVQEPHSMPGPSFSPLPGPPRAAQPGQVHGLPAAPPPAVPQLADTPGMQRPVQAAQGAAQSPTQTQVSGAGLITSIITGARSSMDAGFSGEPLLRSRAPQPMQAGASASREQSGRPPEQRRPGTPTRDQGFTVYQNELAAGADAAEQAMRPPPAQAAAPSDSSVRAVFMDEGARHPQCLHQTC